MKVKPSWMIVPALIIIGLSVACGYLLDENASCTQKNRQLLLQNDSILSVNLNIRYELEKMKHNHPDNTANWNDNKSAKR